MKTIRPHLCAVLVAGLLALPACSPTPEPAPATQAGAPATPASAAGAAAPGPAVSVTTVTAKKRDFPVNLNATGTVTALTSVELRAQISSTVARVHFSEGQFVKAGQLLFTLDARSDAANVAKARAQLAKDNASLADAKRQWARAQQLLAQNFVSQGALDTAQALVDSMTATVAADQAALEATQVAQSYARITAPNAGRAGAVNVSVGSAVQANQTPLVTITQLDPIGVAFSLPQRHLADVLAALKDGGAVVTATLADGGGSFAGHLQFVDNLIDANSGTVKAKATFANREQKLWPGAFVAVSQTVSTLKDAVVLPQAAIVQGTRGPVVYAVVDGRAVLRPLKLLYAEAGDAAVTGIKPGEVVVLDGKQNVRPGAAVVQRAPEPKRAASGPRGSSAAAGSSASPARP